MKRSLKEVAEFLRARLVGDGAVQVTGVAGLQSASSGDLVFIDEEKKLREAMQSGAAAVIAGKFAGEPSSKPLLVCDQPRLAFARVAQFLTRSEERRVGKECRSLWAQDHEKKKRTTTVITREKVRQQTRT